MITFDGLDDALVGVSNVWMHEGATAERAVYSGDKMVEVFVNQGMTEEEALEWITYNVEGAYVGDATPVVFWKDIPEVD